MRKIPVIDAEECDGCGLCLEACTQQGLIMLEGKASFRAGAECDYCGQCEAVCPTSAISCHYDIVWASQE